MSKVSQKYLKDENGNIFSPIVSEESVYGQNAFYKAMMLNDTKLEAGEHLFIPNTLTPLESERIDIVSNSYEFSVAGLYSFHLQVHNTGGGTYRQFFELNFGNQNGYGRQKLRSDDSYNLSSDATINFDCIANLRAKDRVMITFYTSVTQELLGAHHSGSSNSNAPTCLQIVKISKYVDGLLDPVDTMYFD